MSFNATEIYKRAIDKWGEKSQIEMLQEEATELALAARKMIRNNNDESLEALSSEIADVYIMIEQMKQIFGNEFELMILKQRNLKIKRLEDRLNKNKFNG